MAVIDVLHQTCDAVHDALRGLDDWGLAGTVDGQYRHDLVADAAALEVLRAAGYAIVSEESAAHDGSGIVVVVDPVDGSTNASKGLPWFATSVCALDDAGPVAAVVANQATGARFAATRGGGATCDGAPITPSEVTAIGDAIVAFSGWPDRHLGWGQMRALGAAALDLCAVASGALDGFIDCHSTSLAPWDYLGGLLVCREAGAVVTEAWGRDPVVADHGARRTIVAGATAPLCAALVEGRRSLG